MRISRDLIEPRPRPRAGFLRRLAVLVTAMEITRRAECSSMRPRGPELRCRECPLHIVTRVTRECLGGPPPTRPFWQGTRIDRGGVLSTPASPFDITCPPSPRGERGHRSLARRLIAVGRRAACHRCDRSSTSRGGPLARLASRRCGRRSRRPPARRNRRRSTGRTGGRCSLV